MRATKYRFGPYEFSPDTGDLWKHGVRLRLQRKPQQVLQALLQSPNQTVSRRELHAKLWDQNIFVDFDQGLNVAIKKLRDALCDSTEQPRYVETIPGIGYRFVAEVTVVDVASPPTSSFNRTGEQPEWASGSETANSTNAALRRRWNFYGALLACVIVLVCALVLAVGTRLAGKRQAKSAKPRRSVAVLAFRNLSQRPADAWLSNAIADWLSTEIASEGEVRVVPQTTVARVRQELGGNDPDLNQPDVRRHLRTNLTADLVVSGEYAVLGNGDQSRVRVDIRVNDLGSGEVSAARSLTLPISDVFLVASELGTQLRASLGIAPLTQNLQSQVRSTIASVPDAARLYARGIELLRNFDAVNAKPLLQQVVSEDPGYALGHAALSQAFTRLGYLRLARDEAEKAFKLSAALPREEKLLVEAQYREAGYQWDACTEVYRALFVFYPDNIDYGIRLAAAEISAGKGPSALDTIRHLRSSSPSAALDPRVDLAEAEAQGSMSDYKHEFESATRAMDRGTERGEKLLVARALVLRGDALQALGRPGEALEAWGRAQALDAESHDQRGVAQVLISRGELLFRTADLSGSTRAYKEAISIAKEIGDRENEAKATAGLGTVMIYHGDHGEARRLLNTALAAFHELGNVREEGYTLSLIGDGSREDFGYEYAKKIYERSLAMSRAANDNARVAGRLMDIAIMCLVQADLKCAQPAAEESLRIYQNMGEQRRVAILLALTGEITMWEGDFNTGRSKMQQSLALQQSLGEPKYTAESLDSLSGLEYHAGNPVAAEMYARKAIEEHRKAQSWFGIGGSTEALVDALVDENRIAEAEKTYEESNRLLQSLQHGEPAVRKLALHGRILAAKGRVSEARRLYDQALRVAEKDQCGRQWLEAKFLELELQVKHNGNLRDLERFEQEAKNRGFGMFAQKTQALINQTAAARAKMNQPSHGG